VREEYSSRAGTWLPVAQHGHQRHHPRPAGDQQQRPAPVRLPDEVAADGPAQLELVALAELAGQVGRDLAVVEALDGQLDPRPGGGRGDRVGPLGLVAVLGGEADVDVLAGQVPVPVGHLQGQGDDPVGLGPDLGDLGQPPAQSPQ
jgi:hypothetical protein